MINETLKLDELEVSAKKLTELLIYFIKKKIFKELSDEDWDRVNSINTNMAVDLSTFYKTFGIDNQTISTEVKKKLDETDKQLKYC